MQLKTKWRQYEEKIIRICVSWYLRYPLSYRDLAELMGKRCLHRTIQRCGIGSKRIREFQQALFAGRPSGRMINQRVDETYVKVRGRWQYLCRSVDSQRNIVSFGLTSKRDTKAAKRFFKRAFRNTQQILDIITTYKNASYPPTIVKLQKKGFLPKLAVI